MTKIKFVILKVFNSIENNCKLKRKWNEKESNWKCLQIRWKTEILANFMNEKYQFFHPFNKSIFHHFLLLIEISRSVPFKSKLFTLFFYYLHKMFYWCDLYRAMFKRYCRLPKRISFILPIKFDIPDFSKKLSTLRA